MAGQYPKYRRSCSAVLFSIALFAGCQRPWEAFRQVELGQPIASDSILAGKGETEDQLVFFSEATLWRFPAAGRGSQACAVLDAQNKCIAKRYLSGSAAFWLLFHTTSMRNVLEFQVPPEAYREPSTEEGSSTSPGPSPEYRDIPGYMVHVASLADEADFETLGNRFMHPGNLLYGVLLGPTIYYGVERITKLEDVAEIPNAFEGATQEGYTFEHTNPWGGTIRIRNLGNRTFRVETKYSAIYDAFLLIPDKQRQAVLVEMKKNGPPK